MDVVFKRIDSIIQKGLATQLVVGMHYHSLYCDKELTINEL